MSTTADKTPDGVWRVGQVKRNFDDLATMNFVEFIF